jgi:tagaturonate epimerase
MQYFGFETFENSINQINSTVVFMANENGQTVIIIAGKNTDAYLSADGILGFNAVDLGGGVYKAALTHKNACALRKLFPFTAPVCGLKNPISFGLGDRLGIATPGHIDLFKNKDIFPVFAQQSIRELNLTNRTYEDVLDAVSFAVFREGYKKGFGADGDHLKTVKDIEYALSLNFTMITLDCSEHIKNEKTNDFALPEHYKKKYIDKNFNIEGTSIVFSEDALKECVAIYGEAINFIKEIFNKFFSKDKKRADFEISIDETVSPTTPLQHFFAAQELMDAGVSFESLAPRFCGEFQKGIDYIGDITQFEKEIEIHAAIARFFGYKLSIHSGSDKFSVFPFIKTATQGNFHIKTAGTNWLEAMRVTAEKDPSLYREIHNFALTAFGEAKKYYHVTTDISKIPDVSAIKDDELPKLFENNDVRQLIHITYGMILNHKTPDGSFAFKERLYNLWRQNEAAYRNALVKHIGKHLELLGLYIT